MRILMPNHFPLQGSGSGIYALNVAKELISLGHEVLVVVPDHQKVPAEKYPFPVDVIVFDNGNNSQLVEANFNFPCFTTHPRSTQTFYELTDPQLEIYVDLWRRHITSAAKRFEADIVHAHHIWVAPFLVQEIGLPYVISVHGTDLMGYHKGPRYRQMARKAAAYANTLIAISRQVAADTLKIFQPPEERIQLIWNGFDADIFQVIPKATKTEVLAEFGIKTDGDRPVVSFVGKFTDFKGIDVLLRAAAIYEQALPDIQTVLVGHGQLWEEMNRLRDELDLQNVYFLGHQAQATVALIYNIADVSVVPSRVEPFGLVAVEALACGTPVVATDEGGLPDFINQQVGALVPVDDYEALARAIVSEIRNNTKRTKGVFASRYAVEGFSWSGQVSKMVKLYHCTLEQGTISDQSYSAKHTGSE